MLIPIAIGATAFIGLVWGCLLFWLACRWFKFCRAFNREASTQPEQRNYD